MVSRRCRLCPASGSARRYSRASVAIAHGANEVETVDQRAVGEHLDLVPDRLREHAPVAEDRVRRRRDGAVGRAREPRLRAEKLTVFS